MLIFEIIQTLEKSFENYLETMSTTSSKNEADQEQSSFDDLKHSTYNRFRAKDKGKQNFFLIQK